MHIYTHTHTNTTNERLHMPCIVTYFEVSLLPDQSKSNSWEMHAMQCNFCGWARTARVQSRQNRAARSSQLPSPATCTLTSTNDLVDHTHDLAKARNFLHILWGYWCMATFVVRNGHHTKQRHVRWWDSKCLWCAASVDLTSVLGLQIHSTWWECLICESSCAEGIFILIS